MTTSTFTTPRPRQLGAVNWLGLQALIGKETGRFLKVYAQTVLTPVVTTLLYYVIFSLALGGNNRMVGDIPYLSFLIPGLIMMSVAQNAFANTSSSLVISKIQGNIVDVLMPPLSPLELTLGFTIGGIIRGLAVGFVSVAVLAVCIGLRVEHLGAILFFGLAGSMMLALLGIVGGIWADKFDHLATVQNFIIMPATFLSGTFYAADRLPGGWQWVARVNPFFYMIDGFRYGFIGQAESSLITGAAVMLGINAALLLLAYRMIATGYKLKA